MFLNNIIFVKPTISIWYCNNLRKERILSVFVRQITFSNQAYKKSPRAEGVNL